MYQELEEMRARNKVLEKDLAEERKIWPQDRGALWAQRRIKELEAQVEAAQALLPRLKRIEKAERVVEAARELFNGYKWRDGDNPLVKTIVQALADYDKGIDGQA